MSMGGTGNCVFAELLKTPVVNRRHYLLTEIIQTGHQYELIIAIFFKTWRRTGQITDVNNTSGE